MEVLCGGINTKTPQHAALWRQGHLMHFGFQESPQELNATGRALLENAIVYIARFTEDRPIARTPSGFRRTKDPRPDDLPQRLHAVDVELRLDHVDFIERALARLDQDARLPALLAEGVPDGPGADATAASWQAFLAENRAFLFFTRSGGNVWLIDPLARARGVPSIQLRGPARATREAHVGEEGGGGAGKDRPR